MHEKQQSINKNNGLALKITHEYKQINFIEIVDIVMPVTEFINPGVSGLINFSEFYQHLNISFVQSDL